MTYKNIKKWFFESRKTIKNIIPSVSFDILIISMYYFEKKNDFNKEKIRSGGPEKKRWAQV